MPGAPTTRSVTLVVCDDDELVGSTDAFEVATPWWQDMEPIVDRHPELAVLRILDVRAPAGAVSGGSVRYLAEALSGTRHGLRSPLAPVPSDVTLEDDPLRMPWARAGGPRGDLEWAASVVPVTGTPTQHRTWNLSAIWSMPTTHGEVWLKCLPPFLNHEGRVLEALSRHRVPTLLAQDGHRLLLKAMPGCDGYDASRAQRIELIDELVAIQCATMPRTKELLDLGVPDRRWPALLAAARLIVRARAPHDRDLERLVEDCDDRIGAISECGIDDTLVHTDAHGGNARVGSGRELPVWFDWGDSVIGHPILDVAVLERPGSPFREDLMSHWLEAWGRACPRSDPHRAWRLIRPLAALLGAVVYQGFLDRIEQSERVYHEGDVLPCLLRASKLAGGPV